MICKDPSKQSHPSLAAGPGFGCTRSQLEAAQYGQPFYSQFNAGGGGVEKHRLLRTPKFRLPSSSLRAD
eukprot:760650-Pelagomonas_calceolata.AAC.1